MKRSDVDAIVNRQRAKARKLSAKVDGVKDGPRPVPPRKQKIVAARRAPKTAKILKLVAGRDLERAGPRTVAEQMARNTPGMRFPVGDPRRKMKRGQGRSLPPIGLPANPFTPYQPAPGVVPSKDRVAMDDALNTTVTWAGGFYPTFGNYFDGTYFLGYPLLAEMAQRPEYRRMTERLATEMTRNWIELISSGDEDKTERIKELNDYLDDLELQDRCMMMATHDGYFGRGHIYIDLGTDPNDRNELQTSIGDGKNQTTRAKVGKGSLKALRNVEPMWVYPATYNASDPLAADFFKPELWYCMGRSIHRTRLITRVGRPVPDLLKPAYAFGGLSLTQMAKLSVDNWLRTRQAVADVVSNFSKNGIKTNMQSYLAPDPSSSGDGTGQLFERADFYTDLSDNRGLLLLDKDTEEFFQYNTPLGTLDQLQAQAQEQLCSISGVPVVVLLGLTPHGLNASSEGEIRAFEEWVTAFRAAFFGDTLDTIIHIAMLSLWGEVDEDIGYRWVPLRSLNDLEQEQVEKSKSDRMVALVDAGIISAEEARATLAADKSSGFSSIDVEDVPEPDMGEQGGLPGVEQPEEGDPDAGTEEAVQGEEEDDEGVGEDALGSPFGDRSCVEVAPDVWAWDEAPFEESKHPRDKAGKFATAPGGGGESESEGAEELIDPSKFKSKSHLIAHLLTKGTTAAEVLKHTGWPSVSMPQQAAAAKMKLTKYKEGGVVKYKGEPMTETEIKEAKAAKAAAKAAKKDMKTEAKEPSADPIKSGLDKLKAALPPGTHISSSTFENLTPEEAQALLTTYGMLTTAAKAAQKINANAASIETPTTQATPAELQKAKSNYVLSSSLVPGASKSSLDKFNEQYTGENAPKTDAEALKKIEAFKQLKTESDQNLAAQAAAAKAEQQKLAAEAAEKNKKYMTELGISEQQAFGFSALVKMMGGDPATFTENFKHYEQEAKGLGYPIDGFQCALIKNYTDGGYQNINKSLRAGTWTEAQHVYVRMVNKAIMSMPRFKGTVRRGADLDIKEQQKYVVGNVVEERAFTSTSTESGFSGSTRYVITAIGKRGADVKKLSNHPSESEVLFAARTFFKVTKVEGQPGGSMTVHMEEMDDD